jgi:site-specific DNA recombinase
MIAAIYARKSTDQNVADEEKSVTRQVDRARAYASMKGWAVDDAHVYVDDGISGAEFDKRPGYVALMRALTRPSFQVLILMDQSRLGRSTREVPYALGRIIDADVRVFCYLTDSEIHGATETDQFMLSAMAYVDGMHREQAVQRTRDAMRRKAERGHVAGGTVYGYENRRVADHVERVVHPVQAEVIRRIFRDVAAGDGFCRIAKRLNAEGIPSPTRRGWAISGVRELVMRDLYQGRQVYGSWERRKGTKHKVRVPAGEWIVADVPALRIVDDALWQAAQRRLADTRAVYARLTDGRLIGRPEGHVESPYLFTGFLRCETCGGSVNVSKQPSRGVPMTYYVCSTHRTRGTTKCAQGLRARLEPLEQAILGKIARDVLTEDVLAAVVERTVARHAAAVVHGQDRRGLEAELREVQLRIGRYVRAVGDGVAVEEIRAALAGTKVRERALLAEIAALSYPRRAVSLDRAALRRRLVEWHSLLGQGVQVARQLLRKLLPEPITLEPTPEGIRFRGRAAWGPLLSGGVQELGVGVAPG